MADEFSNDMALMAGMAESKAMIPSDELSWRRVLIKRLDRPRLIEHIVVNHLWRVNPWLSPADAYAMPTDRHPVLLSAMSQNPRRKRMN